MSEEIIVLGVVLSVIFYEITGISPGGIIVPGYLSFFLDNPKRIIITIGISIATVIIVKIMSNYMIIYGRRKFIIFIVIAFFIKYILGYLSLGIESGMVIGILIPGILAQEIERNGYLDTLSATAILSIIIRVISNFYYSGGLSKI